MKPSLKRSVPSHILAGLAVLSLAVLPGRPVRAQTPPVVTIDECRNLQDSAVRAKIRDVAENGLKAELADISYRALVDKYWQEANVGTRLDKQIDDAVAAVRAEFELARPRLFQCEPNHRRTFRHGRRRSRL